MNLFFGYPQPENVVPTRPWWHTEGHNRLRRVDGIFIRTELIKRDGWQRKSRAFVHIASGTTIGIDFDNDIEKVLFQIDKTHPRKQPELLPGQVWRFEVDGKWVRRQISGDHEDGWAQFASPKYKIKRLREGAILIYGPNSYGDNVPWAPSNWKPEAA